MGQTQRTLGREIHTSQNIQEENGLEWNKLNIHIKDKEKRGGGGVGIFNARQYQVANSHRNFSLKTKVKQEQEHKQKELGDHCNVVHYSGEIENSLP
jgi:hypothetical protein